MTTSNNRSTIASYDRCASDYARSTASTDRRALQNFLGMLPRSGRVLEIGSGPGWDADWLAERGVDLRRTDASSAFVELQRARGALAERLDVVTDDLGSSYAGVIAMYVLQHVDRPLLTDVLLKISRAIIDGGVFLFSLREGRRDLVEHGSSGGTYHVAEWDKPDLDMILAGLGLRECWSTATEDAEGRWLTILTCKDGGGDGSDDRAASSRAQ